MTLDLARPDLLGSFGMCASTHWIASSVGQSVLERDGNAFDAVVAAAFVLHVAEPHLNGPGGDLVALVAPRGEDVQVVSGQGPAPAGATVEHFAAEGLTSVPGAGALAAAVPGAVDAWLMLLADHGTWTLEDVLSYAIHYAATGVPALPRTAFVIEAVADLFRDDWPSSAALWLPDGNAPRPGDLLVNEAYAATLRRLIADSAARAGTGASREAVITAARAVWGSGFVADAIDAFVASTPHRHGSGRVHRGVIDRADLSAYAATYEEPVSATFRGRTVYKPGGWSQGPVLLQALRILEGFDDTELDLTTDGGVHRATEALKLALADREAFYGDGIRTETLAELLSDGYAAQRRAQIGTQASHSFRPGTSPRLPRAYVPPLSTAAEGVSTVFGEPTVQRTGVTQGDTCHLDVVDRWGNMVSATPSGGWLQSSPTIPELGFCLGTRLQMTHLDPASPSALRPGRRPRTTLSPTMVRDDGSLTALGTPGGDQQDQWQLAFLLRRFIGGLSPQAAIEAPMFHTTSFPGSFWPRSWEPGGLQVESRLPSEVIARLEERGHVVQRVHGWSLGRLSTVSRTPSGRLSAASNPRGAQGYAVGR